MADDKKKRKNEPETPGDEESAIEASSEPETPEGLAAQEERAGEEGGVVQPETEAGAEVAVATEERVSGRDKVAALTHYLLKENLPEFRPGDTVKVHVKIVEGNKERIQVFEGVVIGIQHGGLDKTFTVRKTSWGVGVERTFFLHSPKLDKIDVVRRGHVRRAKLYYLRQRAGKSARIRERRATE